MIVRRRNFMVWLSAVGLLAACADDGPDRPFAATAAQDAVEMQILSGGDVGHDDEGHGDVAVEERHDGDVVEEGHDDELADDDQAGDGQADDIADNGHDVAAVDEHEGGASEERVDDGHEDETMDEHQDETAADSGDVGSTEAVVEVEMVEFGFIAETTAIPIGEPVTFRFVNTGDAPHEAMFGSLHRQDEFASSGNHDDGQGDAGHHGDIAAITLEAGETGEIVLEFGSPGEVWIGCHLPGHYDAGMKAEFTVA